MSASGDSSNHGTRDEATTFSCSAGDLNLNNASKWGFLRERISATNQQQQQQPFAPRASGDRLNASHSGNGNNAAPATAQAPEHASGSDEQRMPHRTPFKAVLLAQQAVAYLSSRKQNQLASDEFVKRFSLRRELIHQVTSSPNCPQPDVAGGKLNFDRGDFRRFIFHPKESIMFFWLSVVSLACLYNLWSLIARQAFYELNDAFARLWLCCDLLSDLVYLLDILVQFRTGFLRRGMMVYGDQEMATRYLYSRSLILDVLALTDASYFVPSKFLALLGRYSMSFRCVRFIKVYRAAKWSEMIQNSTRYPNTWRVATLTHFLLLGCHWFAAFYYMLSEYESFATQWTYPSPEGDYATLTRKYLLCFSWSVLTLTNVGADKTPETNLELTFTIICFLLGLYVFAAVVGQVSNVVMEQNAHRMQFEKMLDTAKGYLQTHEVPVDLQTRVIRWYEYMWSKGGIEATRDVNALELLPEKLKTEISIFVHSQALQKVTIFQQCRPEFLHSLVLKMQILICTPGDYICRKNEIAKEMFLIIDGVIEVLNESGHVLKLMEAGDFFGEIGILNLHGGVNRRTADVRSVGYSQLFVLSRDDVLEALRDDPEAEAVLTEYAKERLKSLLKSQNEQPTTKTSYFNKLPTAKADHTAENSKRPSTLNPQDDLDEFINEMKQTFSQTVEKVSSYYRERVSTMEQKIRELEDEVQRYKEAAERDHSVTKTRMSTPSIVCLTS